MLLKGLMFTFLGPLMPILIVGKWTMFIECVPQLLGIFNYGAMIEKEENVENEWTCVAYLTEEISFIFL